MVSAVFLDRDGTIVEDTGFLHEPDKVKLLPGAAGAIKRLNDHGYLVVIVTNQSGIARGLYTVADYSAVQRRLVEILRVARRRIDGAYYPHHPLFTGPCDCRRPGVNCIRTRSRRWTSSSAAPGGSATAWRMSSPRASWAVTGFWWRLGKAIFMKGSAALGVMVVADLGGAVDEILRLNSGL